MKKIEWFSLELFKAVVHVFTFISVVSIAYGIYGGGWYTPFGLLLLLSSIIWMVAVYTPVYPFKSGGKPPVARVIPHRKPHSRTTQKNIA